MLKIFHNTSISLSKGWDYRYISSPQVYTALEMKPKASCMMDKHSPKWITYRALGLIPDGINTWHSLKTPFYFTAKKCGNHNICVTPLISEYYTGIYFYYRKYINMHPMIENSQCACVQETILFKIKFYMFYTKLCSSPHTCILLACLTHSCFMSAFLCCQILRLAQVQATAIMFYIILYT